MTEKRIQRAVNILDYAIKNNITAQEASRENGFAGTYVKNVKMVCKEEYENGVLDDDLFDLMMSKYQEYEKNKVNTNKKDEKKEGDKRVTGEQTKINFDKNVADLNWQGDSKSLDKLNSSYNGYPNNHIKTLDQLLLRCNVDKDIWDVENYTVNKWDVTSWKQGEPQTWENFQVKARLKLKETEAKAKKAGEIFKNMVHKYEPPTIKIDLKRNDDLDEENNILEVSLFDLHFGKLAWNGETGENYDTKIARKRFLYTLKKLIERSKGYSIKRILFPIGNDFFNSDNKENTTSHGTPQDEDLRWQKTFESGCQLMVDGINLLKQLGIPVDVIVIPGNHDFERSFFLGSFISAWFRNDDQVDVNNGAMPRKYYRWGNVLLGFTHGKHEKENTLPMLMAKDKESKKHWSETEFHEWHLGHFHRKKTKQYTVLDKTGFVEEEDGVIVRYLSSLTGTEEWHFLNGYVGQIKAGEAFIWNDKLGMIGNFNANYIFEGPQEEKNNVDKLLKMK